MITPAAAALLAQIYPVALLIVVIEARHVPIKPIENRQGMIWVLVRGLLAMGVVSLSGWAVFLCVVCVTQDLPLHAWGEVASVIAAGVALLLWVLVTLLRILFARLEREFPE